MSITIFEGPDGSGKTTLAQAAYPDHQYAHLSAPKGEPWREVAQIVDQHRGDTVFDRLHLSDEVYGPIFRGTTMSPWQKVLIERWLQAHQSVVVICLPEYRVGLANWAKRAEEGGEMYDRGYDRVYEAYAHIKTDLPVVRVDYQYHSPESVRRLADARRMTPNNHHGVGNPWGSILVLGDYPGSTDNASLEEYLEGCTEDTVAIAEHLSRAGIPRQYTYFSPDLPPIWRFEHVLALDPKAFSEARRAGLNPVEFYYNERLACR